MRVFSFTPVSFQSIYGREMLSSRQIAQASLLTAAVFDASFWVDNFKRRTFILAKGHSSFV